MTCDLQELFGPLVRALPRTENDEMTISRENLPEPPSSLQAGVLTVTWGWHFYSSPIARVDFSGYRQALQALGLLVLAKVFHHSSPRVTVELARPKSPSGKILKRLILDYSYDPERIPGYARMPDRFSYVPERLGVHPWSQTALAVYDLPRLDLGDPERPLCSLGDYADAEEATGFGDDYGNVLMGELLLNLGNPLNEGNEVGLEGELGCRGVGAGSAEMRFFLPGHVFYNEPGPWSK